VAGEEGFGFIDPIDGYEGFVIGHDGIRQWTAHFPFAPTGTDLVGCPRPSQAL
jgi:hypothetical protein